MTPIMRRFSVPARLRFGRALGSSIYRAYRSNARLMRSNIHQALGVEPEEADRIARDSYRHLGRVFAETLALPGYFEPEHEDLSD